jgi:hypothetical protein
MPIDALPFGSFNKIMKLKYLHLLFAAVLLTALWGARAAEADEESARKYPVLSAYIYNFTQFTSWPSAEAHASFTVCVAGHDPFGAALEPMKSRTVQGKKIIIRHFGGSDDLSGCNIVFISKSESGNFRAILARLKGTPVLTMSEIDGFSSAGGMVEFKPANGKIGITIDLPAVRATGISISSKLLSLANVRG